MEADCFACARLSFEEFVSAVRYRLRLAREPRLFELAALLANSLENYTEPPDERHHHGKQRGFFESLILTGGESQYDGPIVFDLSVVVTQKEGF